MAIHHAKPAELVDLNQWPNDVEAEQSHTLIRTDTLQLSRIVLTKDKALPEHSIESPVIIQCVKGLLELATTRATQTIGPGQLVHLVAEDPHSILALEDSIILLTIFDA